MKKIVLIVLSATLLMAAGTITNTDKRLNAKQNERQKVLNAGLSEKEAKWAKKDADREAKLKARNKELGEKALRRELER